MTQNNFKKCDWVSVFKNNFYFIETKDISIKQRKKQRNDAIDKFNDTIPYYVKNNPSLFNMNLIVVINFRNKVKLTRATNKAKAYYIKEEYNADYIETNHLEFK